MIEFIESIMCFESLLQVWNLVIKNPLWILAIFGIAIFFGLNTRKKVDTCEFELKLGEDRIRYKSSRSH